MQAFYESYVYMIYHALREWLSAQWAGSKVVQWFTRQPEKRYRPLSGLRARYCALFRRLGLPRLLEGSIFLHPAWFAAGAVVLAPLVPTMAVLGLVAASCFSLVLRMGTYPEEAAPSNPLSVYVVLYAGIYLYATLTSVNPAGSLFPGLLTVLFVLFFLVLGACRLDLKQLRTLFLAMTAAGVLVACYGFYQKLFPARFRSVWTDTDMFSSITFRVYSTLENPNMLGIYFLLAIPVAAALLLTAKRRGERLLLAGACGMMLVCLLMTYSRGCYLALLVAAALFLVMLDRRFLVAGLIALALSPLYLPESIITRFTSIGNMGDTSTSYRVYIWLGTLEMLKRYWFSGVGPGNDTFSLVYSQYAYNAITAPHAHNLFLQIICDTGICGLAVFLILIVAYYRMMFTAIHRTGDRTCRIFLMALTSAVTGFLVEGMTDYAFYNYRVLLLFWSVLGLSAVLCRAARLREEAAE